MMAERPATYRQAGTPRHGALFRGPPPARPVGSKDQSSTSRSVASIPSRYETVFTRPKRPLQKGFSSTTQRFPKDKREDGPAPGQYHTPTSAVWDSVSLSKKGFGTGFASKTVRSLSFAASTGAQVPGPGSYDVDQSTSFTIDNRRRHFNRRSNVTFGSDQRFRSTTPSGPGPQDYHSERPPGRSPGISFSKAPRKMFTAANKQDAPPPGPVDLGADVHVLDEGADEAQRQPPAPHPSSMFMGAESPKKSPAPGPGPASYDVDRRFGSDLFQRGSVGFSSMFSSTTVRRRRTDQDNERRAIMQATLAAQQQRRYEKPPPGRTIGCHPRQIKVMQMQSDGRGCETRAFRPDTHPKQSGGDDTGGPGPAQYDVAASSVVKKSFRSRRIRHWVGN
ncbi:Sperm-tail PG-rich repeat [Plasmodiophora brassicae]